MFGVKCKLLIIAIILLLRTNDCRKTKKKSPYRDHKHRTTSRRMYSVPPLPRTKRLCLKVDNTLRARHKTCFLRPDTGPCRADIIQWYFDVKQRKCFRFFWGGCQGNGNRFESSAECVNYCHLNASFSTNQVPFFCSFAFDYGSCFGHYNRWTWDRYAKSCKSRIYSGCGGNQNNFQTKRECLATCLAPPNNTVQRSQQFTTCVPFHVEELY